MAVAWVCRCNRLRKWAQRGNGNGYQIGLSLSRLRWHIRVTHLGRIPLYYRLHCGLRRNGRLIQSPLFSKYACLALLITCLRISLRIAGGLGAAWFDCNLRQEGQHCDDCRLARGTEVVDAVNRVDDSRSTCDWRGSFVTPIATRNRSICQGCGCEKVPKLRGDTGYRRGPDRQN
jgi:hypothetical protein